MMIRCMVVDDEPLARRVLRNFIDKLPSLELVKECSDAMEASAYLHAHQADLIFLDIKMPEMTGMEFLKSIDNPPQVIITTAYSEYALEGYEFAVIDYLLKPIPFERFLKAVNKALRGGRRVREVRAGPEEGTGTEFIFIKADRTEHRIRLQEVICFEAWRNFVKVHMAHEVIHVPETMAAMETSLPSNDFIRVHKSFIVAVNKIERIQGNKVHLQSMTVPIGKYYKKEVARMVESHRLGRKE